MRWLKHAFSIQDEAPFQPTQRQREVAERVCREIVRRGLTMPTLVFLESSRPLNYLGSQTMHFFAPMATLLVDQKTYQQFATLLEHRRSIDYLCRLIEELDSTANESSS